MNSGDQLDFLEVPYLMIVLMYDISSIIPSLFILYIVDKETGKYFLNQVWLSLAAVNKLNQEWNWIIMDTKVYKCARVGGHTEKFVFPWFNSCYRPFIFHLWIILYNFLVCNILLEIVCYIDVLCCICKIYIHPFSKRFFHRERCIDRYIVLLCCTCSRPIYLTVLFIMRMPIRSNNIIF